MLKFSLINVVLFVLCLLIMILSLEFSLRIISWSGISPCISMDSMDTYNLCIFVHSHNKTGFNLLHADHNYCASYDSNLGWLPLPNCSSYYYNTNSNGLRGTNNFNLVDNSSDRVLFIGDSFTWGDYVFDNETYPFYFEQIMNNSLVSINGGVYGFSIDQMYLYLKDLIKFKPSTVVLGYYYHDFYRIPYSFSFYWKPSFKVDNSILTKKNTLMMNLTESFDYYNLMMDAPKSYLLSFAKRKLDTFKKLQFNYISKINDALLIEINSFLKERNINLIILFIPSEDALFSKTNRWEALETHFKDICFRNNLTCYNSKSYLQKYINITNLSFAHAHLTNEGNYLLALEFSKYFIDRDS